MQFYFSLLPELLQTVIALLMANNPVTLKIVPTLFNAKAFTEPATTLSQSGDN